MLCNVANIINIAPSIVAGIVAGDRLCNDYLEKMEVEVKTCIVLRIPFRIRENMQTIKITVD